MDNTETQEDKEWTIQRHRRQYVEEETRRQKNKENHNTTHETNKMRNTNNHQKLDVNPSVGEG